jgi:hypothetical protein
MDGRAVAGRGILEDEEEDADANVEPEVGAAAGLLRTAGGGFDELEPLAVGRG